MESSSAPPHPHLLPRVTLAIVAANVAVHLAMTLTGADTSNERALLAWGVSFGPKTFAQPWRLLTASFVHFTTSHVVSNMLFLAGAGIALEGLVGRARVAAIYFAACIVAGVAGLAAHPQGGSAGASGAILGLYGALGATLLRRRGPLPAALELPLWLAALGFLACVGLFVTSVDVAGHLGGLAGGTVAGAWLAPSRRAMRPDEWRAPALVALSTVAFATAALLALPAPVDLAGPLERFASTEQAIAARVTHLRTFQRNGILSEAAMAATIREEMVRPWHELRSVLPGPAGLGQRQQRLVALLNRYAAAQEELWTRAAANPSATKLDAQAEALAAEVVQLRGELAEFVLPR